MAEHRFTFFRSAFPRAGDLPQDADVARAALVELRHWDGHRRDDNGDGQYDDAALTILRAWLDTLRQQVFEDDLGAENVGRARIDSELWQAVSPDAEYDQRFDWRDGATRREATAKAFAAAVDTLRERFETDDPRAWRTPVELQPYTRMDADIPRELALTTACGEVEPLCALQDRSRDSGFPGDIPEHMAMDRGTYNHIVEYLDRPRRGGSLGAARSHAGSVIPPGQSGHIDGAGRESAHFEDQLPLYLDWRYKPMPLALDDVRRQAEASEQIEMPTG
jgi:penicillin amidase